MAYLKPGPFIKHVFNPIAKRFGIGDAHELLVKRRKSGTEQSIPVTPIDHGGERYLVSVRGESQWVRNMRAAGGGELRGKSGTQRFTVVELPPAETAAIIAAYREKAGSGVKGYWKKLPDDADHPVFRVQASR